METETFRSRRAMPMIAMISAITAISLTTPAIVLYLLWPVGVLALIAGSFVAGAVGASTGVPGFATLVLEYLFLCLVVFFVSCYFVFWRHRPRRGA